MTDLVLFETEGDVTGASASIRQCQTAPLSLKSLQEYCKAKGHDSVVLIQGSSSLDALADQILSHSPKIAAATASTCEFPLAAQIMKRIKGKNPGIVTMVGGYQASAFPQSIDPKQCSPDTDPSGIDLLVVGEGEKTLDEVVSYVKQGSLNKNLPKIKGLAYLADGKLQVNPRQELIQDLDSLPRITWTDQELKENIFDGLIARKGSNKGIAVVISERGCPYACGFCSTQNVYGKTVRTRSIKSLVEEIRPLVKERNVDLIVDYAPTANRDFRRVLDLSEEIQRRGLAKQASLYQLWRLETPEGKLMITEELLKSVSDAFFGFKAGIGIEALTEQDEEYISKRHSLDNLKSASESFDRHGAVFRGFFMITPQTSQEAIEACRESQVLSLFDDLRVTYLVPYPGSPLYEQAKNNLLTYNWKDFTGQQPVIKPDRLTTAQHNNALKSILQGFLLNPYRHKRIQQKLQKFPQLTPGMDRYHEKMDGYGFQVLS